jgi:hypothetical protein
MQLLISRMFLFLTEERLQLKPKHFENQILNFQQIQLWLTVLLLGYQ